MSTILFAVVYFVALLILLALQLLVIASLFGSRAERRDRVETEEQARNVWRSE